VPLFAFIPVLLLLGLILLAVVRSILAIVRAFNPEKPLGSPRCGACGYDVAGLPGWTCPECGRDLGRVGVFGTHQRRVPFSKVRSESFAAVTVLCLIGFVAGLMLGLSLFPRRDAAWLTPLILAGVAWLIGLLLVWRATRRSERRHREELLRPVAPGPSARPAGESSS